MKKAKLKTKPVTKPMATIDLDATWEAVANGAIRAAENVECSLEDFAAGLREIELTIHERRLLADAEVSANRE